MLYFESEQKMNARIISYDDVRKDVAGVVSDVYSGGTVLIQEANKPVAAIISFENYLALREQLDEDRTARVTDEDWERAALEVLEEYDGAWRRLADL